MDNKTLQGLRDAIVGLSTDIDVNISRLIKSRVSKDLASESKCIMEQEHLLVECEQMLAVMRDVIEECYIIPKPSDKHQEPPKDGDKYVSVNSFEIRVVPQDYFVEDYVYVRNEDYRVENISEDKVIDRYKQDNTLDVLKAKLVDVIMKNNEIDVYCTDVDGYDVREELVTYNDTEEFIDWN